MKLPKHHTLSIEHNPHKSGYETVQKYIENWDHLKDSISKEDLAICIEKDELWHFQWYPNTPISFNVVLSYSFERCLELSAEELYDY